MKSQHLLSYTLGLALFSIYLSTTYHEIKGQPDGISGYSSAKSSCNVCHYGIQTTTINHENALLTSDIPTLGYIPGTTYNVTLYMKTQKPKLGFNLRAQNTKGTLAGTANNVTNGKILSGEVVHNSTNSVSNGHKTVTFKWTAPAIGTGNVTFWGSIAINPIGTQTMDSLNKINIVFPESETIGVSEEYFTPKSFTLTPTLTLNQFEIKYHLKALSSVRIELYNSSGTLIKKLLDEQEVSPGELKYTIDCSALKTGLYPILVKLNNEILVTRIYIY